MRTASELAFVAVGGAIGSLARYGVGRAMNQSSGSLMPWHTFAVNVIGSFAIGLLLALATRYAWPTWWRPLLAVGVLGGFTTFSTFSIETVDLVSRGHGVAGLAYAGGSLLVGLAACAAGVAIGRAF